MLCSFLPSRPDKTDFDCAQTRILANIPKNRKKKRKHRTSVLPLYKKQRPKALIFQPKGPRRPSWVQTRQIPRFKKIAGRGHKFCTHLRLWNLILKSPIQHFQVPATHSGLLFSQKKPLDVTLWAWATFSISKRDPEDSDLAKITRFWEEQPHRDNILTGLAECETFVNSLVPLFGFIQQYQAAQAPSITSNFQRTFLGNHNIPKSIEVETSINRSTVCLVRTIQLGCSNLLENNIFEPFEQLAKRWTVFSTLWLLEFLLTLTMTLNMDTLVVLVKQLEASKAEMKRWKVFHRLHPFLKVKKVSMQHNQLICMMFTVKMNPKW